MPATPPPRSRTYRPPSIVARAVPWLRIALGGFLPVATVAVLYLARTRLVAAVSAYGVLAVARVLFQAVVAARVRRRRPRLAEDPPPFVSIVVAVFNEPAAAFEAAIRSLARQHYPAFEVIVVDDGSNNAAQNKAICDRYGVCYAYQNNAGKRHALYRAFKMLDPGSRYVLTGDSDTVWRPDAAAALVAAIQADRNVGAATGHVATSNPGANLLTRMIALRYWVAFEVERAAQGWAGLVTCVSGPLGAYRRELVDQIADAFITQRFAGRECTFGDDRHLTNLILGRGYTVAYTSAAVAHTAVPSRFSTYLRQQSRWGKSHWREMLWTLRALPMHSTLLALDWAMTLVLPFLLVASLTWAAATAAAGHPGHLARLGAVIVAMGLVRALPGLVATRDPWFLLLAGFGVFHVFVLLPLKFWSLVRVRAGHWGTRPTLGPATDSPPAPAGPQPIPPARGTAKVPATTAA